ncbi:bifunctional diaminohydroxyphosphoribosylaminopyrimidine deaminase/5-amino-6-(5-phosphoribosylamino)uracil reductase RibD [Pokkaliibacter sp. CJK22405]|uniref:bifunctional diaminohydroxyphosphoribosylaminopyrimidine deaminase/5-amino-6-(5-phosphoribosylamino)uracil reductase RibD n=1 Tax=Pokkaliibacter sp. CJK22405 TaxID=3384615 RepID=UPI0039849CDD
MSRRMADWSADDQYFMSRAIELAAQGRFTTHPNPRVGCVIVKDGKIIGEGYHQQAGGPHAEVHALQAAGDAAQGATAYVTLEPCAHFGKTPPCALALVNAGLERVVSAMEDPNPLVAGKGHQILRDAGIQVSFGLLEERSRALNPGFIQRMQTGMPWVRVKLAMSLDGRTAMASGESQWITGPEARADVQRLRAQSSAVISGIDTVLMDEAALTVRPSSGHFTERECAYFAKVQPLRVILDSRQRLAAVPDCRLLQSAGDIIHVHNEQVSASVLEGKVEPWCFNTHDVGGLESLLRQLAERQCNEVLVEAGARLAGAFVAAGLVNELVIYMAPTLMGSLARPLLDLPLNTMAERHPLSIKDISPVGADWRITAVPAVKSASVI